jgi:hypothetical protein
MQHVSKIESLGCEERASVAKTAVNSAATFYFL